MSRLLHRTLLSDPPLAVGGEGIYLHAADGRRIIDGSGGAAVAVQQVIQEDGLIGNVRAMGERLAGGLTERLGNHRHVGDIRGRGLFWALEFVRDRGSKTPFDPALRVYDRVKAAAFDLGLAIYPMGGTIDGRQGDHVIVAPPYIVSPAEIDTIVARLGDAVDAALSSIES